LGDLKKFSYEVDLLVMEIFELMQKFLL